MLLLLLCILAGTVFGTAFGLLVGGLLYTDYGPWYAIGFAPIFDALFWVILIVAVILIIRWSGPTSSETSIQSGKTALDILQERYARGEIDREEFQKRKREL